MGLTEESIIETEQGTIKVVQYNRPKKKNAIDIVMYKRVISIFDKAAVDDNVSVMVLTGTGDFYSSGNDFSTSKTDDTSSRLKVLKKYIDCFIRFPKPLVAIVNGPAIGIAATTLALCDLVFASENAYFYTPFSKLGIVAEGCSTVTFPRIMGDRKATEMLMFNYKMSAREALDCGLINDIYKPDDLQTKVWDKILEVSELPQHSILATKKLIRETMQDDLLKANEREIEQLNIIWTKGLKSKI